MDVRPIPLKSGVALALFLAGLLYHRIRTRRVKPKLPPSTDRSGEVHSEVDAAAMKRKRSSSETGSTSQGTSGALYDVFLSFRGPDTRLNFTDTLHCALEDKGLKVFIDKKGIDVGDEIGHEIYQAIDDSKVCIPIFSTGYASSRWCLRELEHMMKRRKNHVLEVMPIFYDVDPSVVKLETGAYSDALTQHKRECGDETVQGWEEALKEVTKIKGWDTKNTGHGKLAKQIAFEVLGKLRMSPVRLSDPLVGIDKSVDEVEDLLSVESEDIRVVGICGVGGIGKTTLAKVVYNKLSAGFQSCSFILDIRQASESLSSGLLDVQRKLLRDILGDKRIEISSIEQGKNMIEKYFSEKKVLIVLDDVNDGKQLKALAEERKWFGSGSRIVVTTRDKNVLSVFENSLTYDVKELNSQESLELFSKHAFRSNSPPSDFVSLSKEATARAGGLPLIIEVIGSLLRGKEKAVWEETLEEMENYRHEVQQHLMLSYNALNCKQKKIFLDIACFLAGKNNRDATYMWKDCKLSPMDGIQVLLSRSLVKIGVENELWMHDHLKDLGRSIVLAENQEDPGKRSRVWNHKEASDMITGKKGTKTVEAICVDFDGISLTSEEFKKVPNIRFLEMTSGNLSGNFEDLFSELRWLSWKNCPSNLQATNFCPEKLLVLNLSRTEITQNWNGWTQLKVATRLKVLNLSYCYGLDTTPDLSAYSSLEVLILECCRNLVIIHDSIGHLKCLKHLNLNRCLHLQALPVQLNSLKAVTEQFMDNIIYDCYGYGISIREVPTSIGALINLELLVICGNSKLMALPHSIGSLKSLVELNVSYTGITEFPDTIVNLKSLKVLKMNRSGMKKLPEAIGELEKLEEIYGVDCNRLEMIPSDIERLPLLKILKLIRTRVEHVPKLPESLVSLHLSSSAAEKAPEISNLVKLKSLKLCFGRGCDPHLPKTKTDGPWCKLELPSITSISSYMGCFCCLEELWLIGCKNLRYITQLPSSLRKLTVEQCNLLEDFNLSNLESLLELTLYEINILNLEGLTSLQRLRVYGCRSSKFNGLERPENLRLLCFADCDSLRALPSLSNLKNLKHFELGDCPKLVEIEGLDKLESLESLSIGGCPLQTLPSLSNLKNLKYFELYDCSKLVEIEGLDKLESLETLLISGHPLQTLPDLSNLKNLKRFELEDCPKLVEIEGLDKLESLESILISGCSLQALPSLSNLKNLKHFTLRNCPKLVEIEGLDKLESLKSLSIRGCSSLRSLPDLSHLKKLKNKWCDSYLISHSST